MSRLDPPNWHEAVWGLLGFGVLLLAAWLLAVVSR